MFPCFGLSTLNVTSVVADACTFSAVRSDVSYAAPDSGYTWSETDTPEATGKSGLPYRQTQRAGSACVCVAALHSVAGHHTWLHVYTQHACMYPQTVSLRC